MSHFNDIQKYKDYMRAAEDLVCEKYNIKREVIYKRDRKVESTHSRFAVWYTLHMKHDMPASVIGQMYGYDHSTVLSGILRAMQLNIPYELGLKPRMSKSGKCV